MCIQIQREKHTLNSIGTKVVFFAKRSSINDWKSTENNLSYYLKFKNGRVVLKKNIYNLEQSW